MSTVAVVEAATNAVRNIIVAAPSDPAPEGVFFVPAGDAAIGDTYDPVTGGFLRPQVEPAPAPVPPVVSRFQGRAALLMAGKLEQVEAIIAQADALTRLAWAEAVEWRRESPMVAALASALGMTAEQVDDLFRTAAGIEA